MSTGSALPPVGRFRWRGALRHRNFRLFWFGQLISVSYTHLTLPTILRV